MRCEVVCPALRGAGGSCREHFLPRSASCCPPNCLEKLDHRSVTRPDGEDIPARQLRVTFVQSHAHPLYKREQELPAVGHPAYTGTLQAPWDRLVYGLRFA